MQLTKDQQAAYDLVLEGKNVCILGIAGAGKSFLINEVISYFNSIDKSICVSAPTGIAAINVGGCTLHRLLCIGPKTKLGPHATDFSQEAEDTLSFCDVLILDEISMCRADLFDYLMLMTKRANRRRKVKIQIICVGDFFQLPPVVTDSDKELLLEYYGDLTMEGYAFQSKYWDSCNFSYVNLKTPVRQTDETFVKALNYCRNGNIKGLQWIYSNSNKQRDKNAIILCGANSQVDKENKIKLDQIQQQSYVYRMEGTDIDKYVKEVPAPKDLILKVDARVMTLVNNDEVGYQNGSLGTVTNLYSDCVEVKLDSGDTVLVGKHSFEIIKPVKVNGKVELKPIAVLRQIPIKLAYALTMHKSQGQTLDSAYVYPRCWSPGQLYTAITRVRNVKDLCFANYPSATSLITSKKVLEFFRNI